MSTEYMFFNANRNDDWDTDGKGTEGSLAEHLDYVSNYGGSPEFWDSIETTNIVEAVDVAKESGLWLFIVNTDDDYAIIGEVNNPAKASA